MDIDVDSDDSDEVTEIAAESAEAELSKFTLLDYSVLKVFYSVRSTLERLELTNLRVLQAYPFNRIYQRPSDSCL
jgi:hypothetical protein